MSSYVSPFRRALKQFTSAFSIHANPTRPRALQRSRRLGIESLEERSLLAGIVTLTLNTAGDITLRGDNVSNTIAIYPSFPTLVIQGLDGTLISHNGTLANLRVVFPYMVNRDLTIDMQGGNDIVSVLGVEIGRDLKVNGGAGSDLVVVEDSGIGRDLIANLGADSDAGFFMDASTIGRNLQVDGGTGNGSEYVYVENSLIGGNLTAKLGAAHTVGADNFELLSSSILGNVTVQQTHLRSIVLIYDFTYIHGNLTINTGGGNDEVEIWEATVYGNANINTGAGNDRVELGLEFIFTSETRVFGTLTVNTGNDQDLVILEGIWASGATNIIAGSGNDRVVIRGLTVGVSQFQVDLGAGDDTLEFGLIQSAPIFFGLFTGKGGSGIDRLLRPGVPGYNFTPVFTGFEIVTNPYEPGSVSFLRGDDDDEHRWDVESRRGWRLATIPFDQLFNRAAEQIGRQPTLPRP